MHMFLFNLQTGNHYALRSFNAEGMSPIEVVSSNRVLLSPICLSKPRKVDKENKISRVNVVSVDHGENRKSEDKEDFIIKKSQDKKYQENDNSTIIKKREARSACELRRKPR